MLLRAKTARNLGYVAFMNIFVRIVGMISTIVLMKILSPYDYGLVAIGTILITVFRNLETLGVNAAIIQKDKNDVSEIMLGTGFTIMICMAFLLFIFSFVIAPYWAEIYKEPKVIWLMRFISLTFIISSLGFISDIQLRKKLDFKKYIFPTIGRALSYSGCAITFALLGFKYWSLVFGSFVGEVVRIIIFNKLSPWKIKFRFDWSIAKALLSFGLWIMISGLFFATYSVADNALIGKIMGATMLGYYAVAYRWGHLTSSNVRPIFQTVMFPTFSNIKNDVSRLHRGYLDSLKYISLIVFPITVGWILLADKFVLNVIGEKWEYAIIPLQILSISGLLRSLQVGAELFPALGKPKIAFSITALQLIILIILLYPFILWRGIIGASVAVVATFTISTGYVFYKISRLIQLKFVRAIKELFVPCFSSISMGAVLYILKTVGVEMLTENQLLEFMFLFISGIISYFIFLYIWSKGKIKTEIKNISQILKSNNVKVTT